MNPVPATKKLLTPEIGKLEDAPAAEMRTGADVIEVVLALPELESRDAEITVTPISLRVRRRGEARLLVYALPVAAQAGRFVSRCRNGVYTVLVARARRSQ